MTMWRWRGYDDSLISVVGDRFCLPYSTTLFVKKKVQGLSNAHYDIFDATGNILLQVDGGVWKLQKKRVMRDPNGISVLTMRGKKTFPFRPRWEIHQGEGTDRRDLLCTTGLTKSLQIKTNLDIFLSGNRTNNRDFRVTGSIASHSFKVHDGDATIAEVVHNYTWGSFCKGKDTFVVRVEPDVDYAFIVALIVIVQECDIG